MPTLQVLAAWFLFANLFKGSLDLTGLGTERSLSWSPWPSSQAQGVLEDVGVKNIPDPLSWETEPL